MVYAFFGACLGFIFARLTNWLDEQKARKRFFKAIRSELVTMNEHLNGTLKDATEAKEQYDRGDHRLLYLATAFQREIYDSQINRLKTVSDPLVIEVIQFYDKLSNLERVKSHLTSIALELTGLRRDDEQAVLQLVPKYESALKEVIKRINELLPIVSRLIAKLN